MYQVLARKRRPQSFDALIGQQHIARTLSNAIEADRIAHAYIFSGLRGTGKTSAARILAKCLNCEQGPIKAPCNQCTACTEITRGRSLDVLEMDAASRTGVNDIRELQEVVSYAPARDRYKVLIIDEVHMLSKQAFNALLKTLEEPPPKVIFILATTELQKVLPTILSRCQVFEFRRVSPTELGIHLEGICETEGISISKPSLDRIARVGEGSVRDSLSVLERILAFCGNEISDDDVLQVLGAVRTEILVRMIAAMSTRDGAGMLATLDMVIDEGRDLLHFWNELLAVLRDLLVCQVSNSTDSLQTRSEEEMRALQTASGDLSTEDLNRIFGVLIALEIGLKSSAQPRFLFEAALIRIGSLGTVIPIEQFLEKLSDSGGRFSPSKGQKKKLIEPTPPSSPTATHETTRMDAARETGRDFRQLFEATLKERSRPMLTALMKHARSITLGEEGVAILFPENSDSLKTQAEKADAFTTITECASTTAGRKIPVAIHVAAPGAITGADGGTHTESAQSVRSRNSANRQETRGTSDRRTLMKLAGQDPAVKHLLREFGAQIVDIRPLEMTMAGADNQQEMMTEEPE